MPRARSTYPAGLAPLALARLLLLDQVVMSKGPKILQASDLLILASVALALVLAGTLLLV